VAVTPETRIIIPANRFYAGKFAAARAPGKVVQLGDFSERFPFTTKDELAADQSAHPPYGTNLTFPIGRYTRCHQTSGTSSRRSEASGSGYRRSLLGLR
jgi:phenylacetate-CoA ligase